MQPQLHARFSARRPSLRAVKPADSKSSASCSVEFRSTAVRAMSRSGFHTADLPGRPRRRTRCIDSRAPGERLIGLNVSGLLDAGGSGEFGLAGDYRQLVERLVVWAIAEPQNKLLLVPHVVTGGKRTTGRLREGSDDRVACERVCQQYSGRGTRAASPWSGASTTLRRRNT